MFLENSIPLCVVLYIATVLFPTILSVLAISPFNSRSSSIGLCFLRFRPQKLTRAVWFSSPYSTSFRMMSFTMYILSLYELVEPDIGYCYHEGGLATI